MGNRAGQRRTLPPVPQAFIAAIGSNRLRVFIAGDPAPQGSKKHVGRGIMVESSKKLGPWRDDVRAALTGHDGMPKAIFGFAAVHARIEFVMPRPAGAPKKSTPPASKRPDLDKLFRALMDAITSAGVWKDDAQCVGAIVTKRIAEIGETPGCHLLLQRGGD